jgi:hypothetical protein
VSNDSALVPADGPTALDGDPQFELAAYFATAGYEKYGQFVFAALSALPWSAASWRHPRRCMLKGAGSDQLPDVPRSPVVKSAFDNGKAYEMTELGSQFVHYAMNEVVPRLGGQPRSSE